LNIFYLDNNIEKCAQSHTDTHVIKMVLESVQILCTALFVNGIDAPYKPTHKKHPCVLWASESLSNYLWLRELAVELNKEYRYRWNKKNDHRSYTIMTSLKVPKYCMQSSGITRRPQVMPEVYRLIDNPLLAYRKYYSIEKKSLHTYTKREKPIWIKSNV
jgi:hypothetical protein